MVDDAPDTPQTSEASPGDAPGAREGSPPDIPEPAVSYARRQRPAPRRRPVAFMILGIVIGVLTGAGVAILHLLNEVGRPESPKEAALFARYLSLGEGFDPSRPDDDRCGYRLAWELMSPALRDETPYAVFYEDFDLLTSRHGPIQGVERRSGGGYGRRGTRIYRFRLLLGDAGRNFTEMTGFSLQVELLDHEGDWRVHRYELHPHEDPETR